MGGGFGSLQAKVIEWQTKLVELSNAKDKASVHPPPRPLFPHTRS